MDNIFRKNGDGLLENSQYNYAFNSQPRKIYSPRVRGSTFTNWTWPWSFCNKFLTININQIFFQYCDHSFTCMFYSSSIEMGITTWLRSYDLTEYLGKNLSSYYGINLILFDFDFLFAYFDWKFLVITIDFILLYYCIFHFSIFTTPSP